jgi:7,8-didemethyl-8-hydroxy-5-deazariboflavin synthase CofH subunit/7,8-didemethyl-8-hydroxy-5-deazariboflavin synthase CofG subunit
MLSDADLLQMPLGELTALARAVRDEAYGRRVTYSPKVFIPLTMLCRDRCGYCTFAKAPARLTSPYLLPDEVLAIARAGQDAGCHEALFTLGERPELRYPLARQWLGDNGFASTVEYLAHACRLVLEETGLLPHANAGALHSDELALLRPVSASQGMMVESLDPDLPAHRSAPDKEPSRRLATLDAAGELHIPFTTGILVGIGNDRADQIASLRAIAASHARFGQVQEVIVQNFLPKPGTSMARSAPCPPEDLLWAIAVARLVLPPEVHIQAPPNLSDDLAPLLHAGIDDWGGVSPVTADHVNPERAWPALQVLRDATESAGHVLAARLTIYPSFAQDAATWLHPDLRFPVLDVSDAEGLARDTDWCSGGEVAPPVLLDWAIGDGAGGDGAAGSDDANEHHRASRAVRRGGPVAEVLDGVALGQEVGVDEIVTLFSARGPEVPMVAEVADDLRRQVVGDAITFVQNRNINYTNVCTFKCRFCAFSKGPLSLNLRGAPYLLELSEITRRVAEAEAEGATEVCLQGGIHPDFDGDYYVHVLGAVRAASERIHIHGFTALEVTEGARRSEVPLADYLIRLKEAGLKTLPGTAAEILEDDIRALICPDKINTEQWLEAHRTAHSVGLRSNITIMFGSVEQPLHWARHMVRTRALQRETGGFTEFVPLPFVHMATPIYLQRKARRGPTFRETLLMHSVARIAYHGDIDNIQVSWVKMGVRGSRQVLQAGANDLGGTLMDENISRAAGAQHGQRMGVEELEALVAPLGRPLVRRSTLYALVGSASGA